MYTGPNLLFVALFWDGILDLTYSHHPISNPRLTAIGEEGKHWEKQYYFELPHNTQTQTKDYDERSFGFFLQFFLSSFKYLGCALQQPHLFFLFSADGPALWFIPNGQPPPLFIYTVCVCIPLYLYIYIYVYNTERDRRARKGRDTLDMFRLLLLSICALLCGQPLIVVV